MKKMKLTRPQKELLKMGKQALAYLTDLGIDLDGEEEETLALLRLDLHRAIEKIEASYD